MFHHLILNSFSKFLSSVQRNIKCDENSLCIMQKDKENVIHSRRWVFLSLFFLTEYFPKSYHLNPLLLAHLILPSLLSSQLSSLRPPSARAIHHPSPTKTRWEPLSLLTLSRFSPVAHATPSYPPSTPNIRQTFSTSSYRPTIYKTVDANKDFFPTSWFSLFRNSRGVQTNSLSQHGR